MNNKEKLVLSVALIASVLTVGASLLFWGDSTVNDTGLASNEIRETVEPAVLGADSSIDQLAPYPEHSGNLNPLDIKLSEPDVQSEKAILIFFDYSSPYTQRFFDSTLGELALLAQENGYVLAVKDVPPSFNSSARESSAKAHCIYNERGWSGDIMQEVNTYENECVQKLLDDSNFRNYLDQNEALNIPGSPAILVGDLDGDSIDGRLIVGAVDIDTILDISALVWN